MRRRALCAQMITLALLLAACGGGKGAGKDDELALQIRGEYIGMKSCRAVADVTADYGQRVYEFTLNVSYEKDGETVLTIVAPEEVAGISARIGQGGTALEFDGVLLETGSLNEAGLSPVDGLPALLQCARQGYITACVLEPWDGEEKKALHVSYGEPEKKIGTGDEAALWFDAETHCLLRGEILAEGRRVIACEFREFSFS